MKLTHSAGKPQQRWLAAITLLLAPGALLFAGIGEERSSYERLENEQEYAVGVRELLRRGAAAFGAQWTADEGGGRPLTTGTGAPLADGAEPLVFPRNFNRVSARDANSCEGCHNAPFGLAGGGGDFVTGVFVAAQRFDFASFDASDPVLMKGALDETGNAAQLQTIGNFRATIGMFGSGYIEMLARQMTADLQSIRDNTLPGQSSRLLSKGVSFGVLRRLSSGQWDTSEVEGLPPQSLRSASADSPPSLVIRPFHQSGSVVSIREFTNNAFNHHHGMQSTERFGEATDPDGDGVINELTRADITAVSLFQASLPVPGVVMPRERNARRAVVQGRRLFGKVGCADCHVPALPLDNNGWIYSEPNPYNPAGNLQVGEAAPVSIDLSSAALPGRRLTPRHGVVWVPAFTDLKLHDITDGPDDPNAEQININHPGGSPGFFAGNRQFLTKKLWGAANESPYFHHGLFTTLREATLAHGGEARASRQRFVALSRQEQASVIEFLKSLQVLPPRHRR